MRYIALIGVLCMAAGCGQSSSTSAPTTEPVSTAKPGPAEKKPLPKDVPIPPGVVNRSDSTAPGTDYHVVQGQLPVPIGEAITTVRTLAVNNGWAETTHQGTSTVASISTLSFTKDSRQLSVTLIMVDPTNTNMNLMTGPR